MIFMANHLVLEINWYSPPWQKLPLLLLAFPQLPAFSSLCSAEIWWVCLHPVWHVYIYTFFSSCLGNHAGVTLWI